MTDKELRRLNRADLVDIICQMKQTEEQLRQQLEEANEALASRELKIQQAGSIAQAAISVNGVFEAAQAAANDYLAQIRAANADTARQCENMIAQAQARCDAVDEEIARKWAAFEHDVQQYLQAHNELKNFLSNG